MNRGGFLEDILSSDDLAIIHRISDSGELSFVELGMLAGLDPLTDYRFADLTGVNFTNCDIRGFDFSDADLRGAFGSAVHWDNTTNFAGAKTDGSLFAFELSRQALLHANPRLSVEYRKMANAYWTDQTVWVLQSARTNVENSKERQELALALFFDAKDAVVRNTILQVLVFREVDRASRRNFIVRLISDRSLPNEAMVSIIRIASEILRNDEYIIPLFFDIADDQSSDLQIAREALAAILQNRYMIKHSRRLLDLVKRSKHVGVEVLYVREFARHFGREHLLAVSGGLPNGGLNLRDEVTQEAIQTLCTNLWRARAAELTENTGKITIFPEIRLREDLTVPITSRILDLSRHGLPLRISEAVRATEYTIPTALAHLAPAGSA